MNYRPYPLYSSVFRNGLIRNWIPTSPLPLKLLASFPHGRHLNRFSTSRAKHASAPIRTRLTNRFPVSVSGYARERPTTCAQTYECNSKISLLGRRGKVKEARKVFDEMPERDAVSYASMITAYIKSNDLLGAQEVFQAMPERTIFADSAIISGYVKAGRVDEARRVFDQMVEKNVFSWTSLVSGYFRIGDVDEAIRLFDQMPEKNVVSWTTVVQGYAQNGFIDRSRDAFDRMPKKNIIAWTAMVKAYMENDRIDEAFDLFSRMPGRNLYSWNVMISGCLTANRVNEAIQLFNSMPQRSAITWTTMVTGLARNGMTEQAREYFDLMPEKDIAAWNAMITAYVDEGNMVEANVLFQLMLDKNVVTWNAMIDGYARNGPQGEALKLLNLMRESKFKPNETTITSVVSSCESMLEIVQAHTLIIHLGFEHEISLVNALVTAYSRCGDVRSARFAFDQFGAKDVVSWTSMILAYSNHGYGHHALQIFARMLRHGAKPDDVTFLGILSACSHAGMVNKGQRLFDSMSHAYDLEPRADHYACLVDILGRSGQVNSMMRLVSEMPPHKCDGVVLGALLMACRLHGDVRLANHIGEKLIELEPTMSGSYVLLANAYAARGDWKEFARVRKKMKERNVKKQPGFSQIEVKGKSHLFFSGDKSHPEIEEIYYFLQEKLTPLMQEGYAQEARPLFL